MADPRVHEYVGCITPQLQWLSINLQLTSAMSPAWHTSTRLKLTVLLLPFLFSFLTNLRQFSKCHFLIISHKYCYFFHSSREILYFMFFILQTSGNELVFIFVSKLQFPSSKLPEYPQSRICSCKTHTCITSSIQVTPVYFTLMFMHIPIQSIVCSLFRTESWLHGKDFHS